MNALVQLLLGTVFGWTLSRTRAGVGGEVAHWTGLDASGAAMWSAFGLFLYAVMLRRSVRGPRLPALWGAPLGYALHAFVGTAHYGLPLWDILLFVPVVALFAVALETKLDARLPAANKIEVAGLFVAALGATVALGCVARHVRLLGDGSIAASSAHATTFLVLAAIGASAFTPLLGKLRVARLSATVALAVAATGCLVSLAWLDAVAVQRGLAEQMSRFGLDSSWRGTWRWDAAVAASAFAVPALAAGVALHALRGRNALFAVLLGAGFGLVLMPSLFAGGSDLSEERLSAAQWTPLAAWVCVVGAALAALGESKEKSRWFAVGGILVCGALSALPTIKPVVILAPWARRPVVPWLAADAAAGFVTVEPGEGGLKVATLERKLVTPDYDDAGEDMARLKTSVALVPQSVRAKGAPSVLYVGQLTVLRAAALREAGVLVVDRTAAWHDLMPRMERALFDADAPGGTPLPQGEVLSPAQAHQRYLEGRYALVVCAAVGGEWLPVDELEPPAGTTVVRWLDGDAPLPQDLPDAVWNGAASRVLLVQGRGLESVQFAHVTGGERAPDSDWAFLSYADEAFEDFPRADELVRRRQRPVLRGPADRAANWRALELAQGDGGAKLLCEAGRRFAEDQQVSSPFETGAEQVELEPEVLALLTRVAAQPRLDAYARSCVERAAWTLAEKRDIERLVAFATPAAAAHAPWPALELALARADLESLDAPAAVARLRALGAAAPRTIEYHGLLASALDETDDLAGAVREWRAALDLQPQAYPLRRALAIALVRSGDPAGRGQVEALLQQYPDDEGLRTYLGPGPWPRPSTATGRH